MKVFTLIVVFISIFSLRPAFSQQVQSLHSIKAGFPSITYSYEHALGKQFSVNMEVGTNWGWHYSNNNTDITFSPLLLIEPRLYYNVSKRFKDNLFTNNSANFFCVATSVGKFSADDLSPISILVIPKWGFRRALGHHFVFETQLGGGINFNRNSSQFTPALNINFGYVF